jgi:hypothetical protein
MEDSTTKQTETECINTVNNKTQLLPTDSWYIKHKFKYDTVQYKHL